MILICVSLLAVLRLLRRSLLFLLVGWSTPLLSHPRALARAFSGRFLFFLRGFGLGLFLISSLLCCVGLGLLGGFIVLLGFGVLLLIWLGFRCALCGFVLGTCLVLVVPTALLILLGDFASLHKTNVS